MTISVDVVVVVFFLQDFLPVDLGRNLWFCANKEHFLTGSGEQIPTDRRRTLMVPVSSEIWTVFYSAMPHLSLNRSYVLRLDSWNMYFNT